MQSNVDFKHFCLSLVKPSTLPFRMLSQWMLPKSPISPHASPAICRDAFYPELSQAWETLQIRLFLGDFFLCVQDVCNLSSGLCNLALFME